jgi:general stress protein 26
MCRSGRFAGGSGGRGIVMRAASLAACLLLTAAPAPAQNTPADSGDRAHVVAAAREIVGAARYATLTTIGGNGHPQSRVVDPFEPDSGFAIWIGTNRLTRKVSEIRADPRVTLLYFAPDAGEYVTVVGIATIVTDSAARAMRWKSEWASFYEGGPLGEQYILIRVRPVRLEVVSPRRGILNDERTWLPVRIEFADP